METDISYVIERHPDFEERTGVVVEALYATWDGAEGITIQGEIHPVQGDEIAEDTQIVIAVYDRSGRVVLLRHLPVKAEEFHSFDIFMIRVSPVTDTPTKIRIYPKVVRA